MSKTVYTFAVGAASVTFTRQAGGEFDAWFEEDTAHTESKILRGTSRRTVIDVGGTNYSPLGLRAEFASTAAAATLRGLRAQSGTLSNSRGETATAMLITAKRTEVGNTTYGLVLDLTFKRLS
jgi:hypothetical protein